VHEDITSGDVLDALEEKYAVLRQQLLQLMCVEFSGRKTWEILTEGEQQDLLDEVRFFSSDLFTLCEVAGVDTC